MDSRPEAVRKDDETEQKIKQAVHANLSLHSLSADFRQQRILSPGISWTVNGDVSAAAAHCRASRRLQFMFPVNSVTYLPGCSKLGGAALLGRLVLLARFFVLELKFFSSTDFENLKTGPDNILS